MAQPKVSLSGSAVLVLAALAIAWYLYQKAQGATGEIANAIGGGLYDILHTDPVAANDSTLKSLMAQLKAKGSPQVGSDAYNAVMVDNGRTDLAVQNNLTTIWPPVATDQLPVSG